MDIELVRNRVKLLEEMNEYVNNHVQDEEVAEEWLQLGVPNQADAEMLYFIAKDDKLWVSCCKLFGEIMGAE